MSAFQKLMYSWGLLLKFHGRAESIHSRPPRALDGHHDPFQRLVLPYRPPPYTCYTQWFEGCWEWKEKKRCWELKRKNGCWIGRRRRDAGNGRRRKDVFCHIVSSVYVILHTTSKLLAHPPTSLFRNTWSPPTMNKLGTREVHVGPPQVKLKIILGLLYMHRCSLE